MKKWHVESKRFLEHTSPEIMLQEEARRQAATRTANAMAERLVVMCLNSETYMAKRDAERADAAERRARLDDKAAA